MRSALPNYEFLRVDRRIPRLPSGVRIYAVGDIHGRLDLLNKLIRLSEIDLEQRPAGRPVYVFLGDYIDRGPSSRGTIDRLIEHGSAYECVFLKGNHEEMALNFLANRLSLDAWGRLGGLETLVSYGLTSDTLTRWRSDGEAQHAFHNALSEAHVSFFRSLELSLTCGDFFFVHAGARPNVELAEQRQSDLLWIREEFLSSDYNFGKIIIHGHTPALDVEVRSNRINIDTGAFATGQLTCLVLEGETLSLIRASAA